ncbi:MAG: carboxypeptidase regulatory-like domain-containing protein, partial [Planctomycetes bacterium]|nr:carboxypeptidase regulatory-like domain-containing protein [Planctomycetota bacterium]
MSGRIWIGLVAVVAIVGVGAWLGGLFDEEDSYETVPPPRVGSSGAQRPEGTRPRPASRDGGVQTSQFTPGQEENPAGEAAAGQPFEQGGFRLTGMVVTETGEPVVMARVDLMMDNGTVPGVHQLGELIDSVDSSTEGRFAFEGLEPGERMVLRVTHDEYTMGRAYGINAAERSTMYQIVTVRRGSQIRGTITHTDGRSLEGVRVACYDINVQAYEPEDQIERFTLSASNGEYELKSLAKGMKRVVASQKGLATSTRPTLQVPASAHVDFLMTTGFVIEGTVVEKGTSLPVPGARVMCRASGSRTGNRAPPRVESVRSDENGRYALIGLEDGPCEVWARGQTHLQSQRQIVQAGADNVLVELPPAARLEGRVVDADTGEPVGRYTLLVTGNPDTIISSRPNRRRIIDPEGRFIFAGVQPMKLWMVVRAAGYSETVHGPLTLGQGEAATGLLIKLGRGASVKGLVTDAAGACVNGARVTLTRGNVDLSKPENVLIGAIVQAHAQKIIGVTDAGGVYEVSGLREGDWSIKAEHPLFATDREGCAESCCERDVPRTSRELGASAGSSDPD